MVADFGLWRHQARQTQMYADAAAVAAAHEILMLEDNANVNWAAKGVLIENGVDLDTTTMSINYPPLAGPHAGQDAVEVILQESQSRFFSGLFIDRDPKVQRSSTALLKTGTNSLCILALDPTEPAAFDLNGTADVNVNGCAVQSNSSDAQSLEVAGSSLLTDYSAGRSSAKG